MIAPHVQFHEHAFAEALLIAGRLTEADALHRAHLVREAESILAEFAERWLKHKTFRVDIANHQHAGGRHFRLLRARRERPRRRTAERD